MLIPPPLPLWELIVDQRLLSNFKSLNYPLYLNCVFDSVLVLLSGMVVKVANLKPAACKSLWKSHLSEESKELWWDCQGWDLPRLVSKCFGHAAMLKPLPLLMNRMDSHDNCQKAITTLNGWTLEGKLLLASEKYPTMKWCSCLSVCDFFPGATEQFTVKFR